MRCKIDSRLRLLGCLVAAGAFAIASTRIIAADTNAIVDDPVPAGAPIPIQPVVDENPIGQTSPLHLEKPESAPLTVEQLTKELAEARSQLAGHLNTITNLAQEKEALRKKMSSLAGNARFVFDALRAENTALNQRLAELDALQTQFVKLRAKVNVLEAAPIPFTPEELALLRRPETAGLASAAGTPAARPKLPTGASDLILEAQKLFTAHNYTEAHVKYLEVLELDNRNVYTLGNLATIELELNQTAAAEEHLQTALAINPADTFSLGVLGNLRFRQGKYDLALDALSRAAELNPKDAEVQNFLGVTLSQKGQRAAAETALRKAIQLDPEYGSAHNNLAVIYLTQNPPQVELARWHYQKSLAAGQSHNPELETLIEQAARPPAEARP